MIFAAPINTDAPIYHWPKATLGLIIAQAAIFAAVFSGLMGPSEKVLADWSLTYGTGLHPVQWLTSIFLHAGFFHLAGNLFFLWGLGLIVEGKLGWARFLAVFLTIGVLESAIEQACLFRLHGSSCGSSSVLFGLLAMALLWAPRNEITFGFISVIPLLFRVGSFDVPVQVFALLELALEGLTAWFNGFRPASEILHLAGAALGAGIGWTLLRRGVVDCEGWDLFSLLSRGAVRRDERPDKVRIASTTGAGPESTIQQASDSRARKSLKRIRMLLRQGRAVPAWNELQQTRHWIPDWRIPLKETRDLAQALLAGERWEESVELLTDSIRREPDGCVPARLQTAGVLIERLNRPQAALKLMQPIDAAALSTVDRSRFDVLRTEALRQIDAGTVEFDRQR
jgi:membrane associated rhomboid family serine protease